MDIKQVLDLTPRELQGLNQKINNDSLVDIEQSKQIFDLFDKVPSDEPDNMITLHRMEMEVFLLRNWELP